jgi:IS30 family transposase
MAPKLSLEARMTIIELLRRGWSRMAIAESLGVTEGSVRRRRRPLRAGQRGGRRAREGSPPPGIEAGIAALDPKRRRQRVL